MPKRLRSTMLAIAAAIVFPTMVSAAVRLPFALGPNFDLGGVNKLSPAVTVQDVGKEVTPGLFQVDPRTVKGKRLVLARTDPNTAVAVCIGSVSKLGNCIGVYVDTSGT